MDRQEEDIGRLWEIEILFRRHRFCSDPSIGEGTVEWQIRTIPARFPCLAIGKVILQI
ncbi:hypothetical protein [Massilibacteroides vaginae]|uniref:hypothetical protein n=1 Tax=Massilibacteroides vaginae TaxID=1673718 RepID=UPI0015934220|nr:hypothetical protein [Massilibacteroides vaginae]